MRFDKTPASRMRSLDYHTPAGLSNLRLALTKTSLSAHPQAPRHLATLAEYEALAAETAEQRRQISALTAERDASNALNAEHLAAGLTAVERAALANKLHEIKTAAGYAPTVNALSAELRAADDAAAASYFGSAARIAGELSRERAESFRYRVDTAWYSHLTHLLLLSAPHMGAPRQHLP